MSNPNLVEKQQLSQHSISQFAKNKNNSSNQGS